MFVFEIAKYFIEFAKELVGLGSTLQKADLERRIRLAQHIENISKCLEETAQSFRDNREPYASCGELDEYVWSLPDICKGMIDDTTIQRFVDLLSRRAHSRELFFFVHDDVQKKRESNLMDQAAGQLRAFASTLKV